MGTVHNLADSSFNFDVPAKPIVNACFGSLSTIQTGDNLYIVTVIVLTFQELHELSVLHFVEDLFQAYQVEIDIMVHIQASLGKRIYSKQSLPCRHTVSETELCVSDPSFKCQCLTQMCKSALIIF